MINRRQTLWALLSLTSARPSRAAAADWSAALIQAARAQIGVTVAYDPAYTKLSFPRGDVPRERGVCTDVLIRAYRDAFQVDLQALVNADMRVNFGAYPRTWGLSKPDPSIDHRRVLNLAVFFKRHGAAKPFSSANDFEPGDIAMQVLPGNLPHTGIVSNERTPAGRLAMIHNIGQGTRQEDTLAAYPLTGRYRFQPL